MKYPLLSILIPVRNYDASQLVADFLHLARREGLEVEIIVADDASTIPLTWAQQFSVDKRFHLLHFLKNQGRARTCNRLAEAAHAPWLLIVDCDAQIPPTFSLLAYLRATQPSSFPSAISTSVSIVDGFAADLPPAFLVVCGGLRHPETLPTPNVTLRYRYERHADLRRNASFRSQHPYAQFSTFSLLIQRTTFLEVRFDESCTDYGHEDTLFGAELQRRSIPIRHIDNPLIHIGLEPNEIFLAKTETGLRSLRRLAPQLQNNSQLLTTARYLSRLHLTAPVRLLYRLTFPLLRRNLLGRHPLLPLFSFYKLGYFLTLPPKTEP